MKEFLATWIVIQLILIGAAGAKIDNEIKNKTFDCNRPWKQTPVWVGAVLPLREFVSDLGANNVYNYCLEAK